MEKLTAERRADLENELFELANDVFAMIESGKDLNDDECVITIRALCIAEVIRHQSDNA